MPFKPTDELTMRFTASEWNDVIAQLQEGPYKIVAPLITKINLQAAQHEQRSQVPAQAEKPTAQVGDIAYSNGELEAQSSPFGQPSG